MTLIYKFIFFQFLLIKKVYKKSGNEANSYASSLVLVMYLIIIQNISIILEMIFGFKGILFLFNNSSFPKAPIGVLFALLFGIPIYVLAKIIKIDNKYSIQQEAISKINNTPIMYSYCLIGFIILNFIFTAIVI